MGWRPSATSRTATKSRSRPGGRERSWSSNARRGCSPPATAPEGFVPHHAVVAELHHRFAGLRIGRTEAVFEALLPTVIEQKVIGAEARSGYGRLIRSLGDPAPGPAGMTSPPGAARLARTPYFEFHPFAIERRVAT